MKRAREMEKEIIKSNLNTWHQKKKMNWKVRYLQDRKSRKKLNSRLKILI